MTQIYQHGHKSYICSIASRMKNLLATDVTHYSLHIYKHTRKLIPLLLLTIHTGVYNNVGRPKWQMNNNYVTLSLIAIMSWQNGEWAQQMIPAITRCIEISPRQHSQCTYTKRLGELIRFEPMQSLLDWNNDKLKLGHISKTLASSLCLSDHSS